MEKNTDKNPVNGTEKWSKTQIQALFDLPFNDLLFKAHSVHRENFDVNEVQISTLLSIKTGGCPEDCNYCSQSFKNPTGLKASKLMEVEKVLEKARAAKEAGSNRFCMGAAWRNPKERDMPAITEMIQEVKAMGLETCMTLGMLTESQAEQLNEAGLDYYNHNIDTSPEYYKHIITTRTFDDRLDTLDHVRNAGINVCSGGIVGMGEKEIDRVGMLHVLANLPKAPESVPINKLVPIEGTKAVKDDEISDLDFVRTIAVARIVCPESYVRLSAGRESMNDATQAMCFFAGANSIFYGETLLTTDNCSENHDLALIESLGMHVQGQEVSTSPDVKVVNG